MPKDTFQIQLDGLIKLLAQNLYADPDVFLREMLQNAHDSITRRRELAGERHEDEVPAGLIRVEVDEAARAVRIHDNGCGLTQQEATDYLSTIGRSGTDELRKRLRESDRARTVELIGQFGIGLLSAFIVADRVEVETRSAAGSPILWRSDGSRHYEVGPGSKETVGTTVTLYLRDGNDRYLSVERLRGIITTYADFIGVPVHLGAEPDPANAVLAPWHRTYGTPDERSAAYALFLNRRFRDEQFLHTFPVDLPVEWPDAALPGGVARSRVQGVLAITDRHIPDVNARGTVDLYIQRMFICSANRDVLPAWARFMQGVLQCDGLTPNAARDNIVRNAAANAVQVGLGALIIRELTTLSKRDPARLTEIMRWHAYHVLAMSIQEEHEEFFLAVADLVPLQSDQGPLTVEQYLKDAPRRTDGKKTVYFIAEAGSATQYYVLCKARGIRVFNCGEPFAEEFLGRYAKTWPDRVVLSQLDVAGSESIFEPLAEGERAAWRALEAAYHDIFPDMRCVARVSRFQPVEVPAVVTETRDSESRRKMEQVSNDLAMPTFLRDMLKGFLHEKREPLTLHLNADNPTIQRLRARPSSLDKVSTNALVALWNNALMLRARQIDAESLKVMFGQYNHVIDLLLEMDDRRGVLERTVAVRETELKEARAPKTDLEPTPYVSCFTALPYKSERDQEIFDAFKRVLEGMPYCWRVVRADDYNEDPGLWTNMRKKLHRAHCFAALVSSHNPNVMIEIGRMEALDRPLLLIKDEGSPDLPADLSGRLFVEVGGSGAALDRRIRDALQKQKTFLAQRGERYLSASLLEEHEVAASVAKKLCQSFETWSSLRAADPAAVAAELGIKKGLVEAAQEVVRDLEKRTA